MNKKKNDPLQSVRQSQDKSSGQANLREELIDEAEKEELTLEADEEIEEIEKDPSQSVRQSQDKSSGQENQKDGKVEELQNQLRRVLADYQNLEKRVAEQKANWIISANKDLIQRMLPGLDNLLLADKHTEDQGVKISIKHFMDILEGEGVKKIKTTGEDFDPNLMEAISTVEVDPSQGSGQREGKVVEEVKAGYTLNGEVIRAAQVVVGKASN